MLDVSWLRRCSVSICIYLLAVVNDTEKNLMQYLCTTED